VDLITLLQRAYTPLLGLGRGRSERGATLVEYALLVALIAVVCIVAIGFIGNSASSQFTVVGSSIATP